MEAEAMAFEYLIDMSNNLPCRSVEYPGTAPPRYPPRYQIHQKRGCGCIGPAGHQHQR